jgi:hypothetical protein
MSGPVSGNSRVPWPTTTGHTNRAISSAKLGGLATGEQVSCWDQIGVAGRCCCDGRRGAWVDASV